MKLRKQWKIIFGIVIVLLLVGAGFGLYSFNRWFFQKFSTKEKVIEDEGKENQETVNVQSEEEKKSTTTSSTVSKEKETKKIRATEQYYCSEGDVVEGNMCIVSHTADATPFFVSTSRENDILASIQFDLSAYAKEYKISLDEVQKIVKQVCEEEYGGTLEPIYENSAVSCVFRKEKEEASTTNGKPAGYMCLDKEAVLEGDKCIKKVKIPAKVRYGCPEEYVQDGIYCQEK